MTTPFNSGEPQRHFSARVPEKVGRGVYCTGQVIHDSPKEFVVDFLQGLSRPFQVVARVVMTPATMAEFASTFEKNLEVYTRQFGPPVAPPTPPQERRPTIEEIYENFKLADDMNGGSYANSVIIGHAPTEFLFDFVTAFYPTPSVSARVILPAGHAPKFLNTLRTSLQQYQTRYNKPPEESPPPPPAPEGGS